MHDYWKDEMVKQETCFDLAAEQWKNQIYRLQEQIRAKNEQIQANGNASAILSCFRDALNVRLLFLADGKHPEKLAEARFMKRVLADCAQMAKGDDQDD